MVYVILFGFYWSHFKVYIHLPHINTQRQTVAQFYLWSLFSWASLLYWYYKNMVLRFAWYCLVFIHLILQFYIHLPCINTQWQTIQPLNNNPVISSSDLRMTIIYQGSEKSCEEDHNSDIIRLLQQSRATHYCDQSVLAIVSDLNIFIFSITILDLILRSALVQFSLLRASYLYNLTRLRFYILFS